MGAKETASAHPSYRVSLLKYDCLDDNSWNILWNVIYLWNLYKLDKDIFLDKTLYSVKLWAPLLIRYTHHEPNCDLLCLWRPVPLWCPVYYLLWLKQFFTWTVQIISVLLLVLRKKGTSVISTLRKVVKFICFGLAHYHHITLFVMFNP